MHGQVRKPAMRILTAAMMLSTMLEPGRMVYAQARSVALLS